MDHQIKFHIVGVCPCLMHNGRLKNPFDKAVKEIKKISGKRGKTEEDLWKLAELEFKAGIYTDETGHPIWPGENIERMLQEAAKRQKLGKKLKSALMVPEDPKLIYDGPKTPDELWADERYRFFKDVKVGTSSIMRCRPMFPDWQCKFSVQYYAGELDSDQILKIMSDAGQFVGLSEFRPRFGRFIVKSHTKPQKITLQAVA